MNYADLQVTTHFSFLRGASSAEELFATAALLGIKALGIVDRNSLAGIVRAHEASKVTGVRLIVGCRLDLQCGTSLLVYPTDRAAYGRLCRLQTIGKTRAGKGACHFDWPDVEALSEGLIAVLVPDGQARLPEELRRLRSVFEQRAYCALTRRFLPDEAAYLQTVATAAAQASVPTVVTNDVLYHCASRRMLQDVVTCIRLHMTIDSAGFQKERHADRHLKMPEEMLRLFPKYEHAVRRTWEIAERCRFSLDELTYTYPTETLEDGLTAQERLEKLTWEGAERRYGGDLPDNVATQLRHELNLIERMEYAPTFSR
jgi:error-prone DNA polymerase